MALLKKFYKSVEFRPLTATEDSCYEILLDDLPIVTPKKRKLYINRKDIAILVVEEWKSQADFIDTASMPITKLLNTAIDVVGDNRDSILDEIINYAKSDLLFYRAESPKTLVELQSNIWDPILIILEQELGHRFATSIGINYVKQPSDPLKSMRMFFSTMTDVSLTAVHIITTLTGSALLAFLVSKGLISIEKAWTAAHLDEDWQCSQWGVDPEAHKRRLNQEKDYKAASLVLQT